MVVLPERASARARRLSAVLAACPLIAIRPTIALAEMGWKRVRTPDGVIEYFDFSGIGYAVILIVVLALAFRAQRKNLKRIAARRRARRAAARAAGAPDGGGAEVDRGEEMLAALDRLAAAERVSVAPGVRAQRDPSAMRSRSSAVDDMRGPARAPVKDKGNRHA